MQNDWLSILVHVPVLPPASKHHRGRDGHSGAEYGTSAGDGIAGAAFHAHGYEVLGPAELLRGSGFFQSQRQPGAYNRF